MSEWKKPEFVEIRINLGNQLLQFGARRRRPGARAESAVARAGPWRSRERLSHMRSVVAGDQQFVKTPKK